MGMVDDEYPEYDDSFLLERRQRPSTLGGVDWRYEKGGVFTMINCLIIIHIIGAIVAIVIHCRDGTMEHASKYGDGFRFAKPSDIIFQDCLLWEIQLVVNTLIFMEDYINSQFSKHFH